MHPRDLPLRRSQLKDAAYLLIQGRSVRDAAAESTPRGGLPPLSASMVGRLRKHLGARSATGHPASLNRAYARSYAEEFARMNVRGQSRADMAAKQPKRRGRPQKAPAPPAVGTWQKTKVNAAALSEEVVAAADGSAIGRKPYVVKVTGLCSLVALSPTGRRAYSFLAEKPLRPMVLAEALMQLQELTGAGLRVYHDAHPLFWSPRVRARLGRAAFVPLAGSTAATERESGKVGGRTDLAAAGSSVPQLEPRPTTVAAPGDWD